MDWNELWCLYRTRNIGIDKVKQDEIERKTWMRLYLGEVKCCLGKLVLKFMVPLFRITKLVVAS